MREIIEKSQLLKKFSFLELVNGMFRGKSTQVEKLECSRRTSIE